MGVNCLGEYIMRAYKYKLIRFYVSEEGSIAREREFAKFCSDGESVGH